MIMLPKEDFKIIFEGFTSICNEYAGAKEVEETYLPIYEKYLTKVYTKEELERKFL